MSGECHPRKMPAATVAKTPEACRCSAVKYAMKGVSSEIVIWTGGSSRWLCTQRIATPTSNPIPIPAAAAQRKRDVAYAGEKVPVTSAATANCRATSAVAIHQALALEDYLDAMRDAKPADNRG